MKLFVRMEASEVVSQNGLADLDIASDNILPGHIAISPEEILYA